MKKVVAIVIGLSCTGVLALSSVRGAGIPFADQWPLYEALRNTAAIVFAVIGAWLAIVYPERLKVGLGKKNGSGQADATGKVKQLLMPVVHSTLILAVVLIVGLVAPLVRDFDFVRSHVEAFRGVSYVLLACLTLLQVWTVVLTLLPASDLHQSVAEDEAVQGTVNAVFGKTRRGPRGGPAQDK